MSTKNKSTILTSSARRLPRYFRCLREMLMNGVMKTSSKELASKLEITPSRVRSDLNRFSGAGQQGYGYNVKMLYTEISLELGVGELMTAVIIGSDGYFAERMAERFEGRGVTIKACFTEKGTDSCRIPVYPYDSIEGFLKTSPAQIAVIVDMPDELTPEGLVSLGIRGMWNMTQSDIKASVPVINLPVGDIIMGLCYEIKKASAEGENNELPIKLRK